MLALLGIADEAYLRATQALAMVSYLSIVLTAFVVSRVATRRLAASASAGLIVALASVLLSSFVMRDGVDPLAILLVSLGIYWLCDWRAFSVVVIVGAAVNEKVPIILASLLALRATAYVIDGGRFVGSRTSRNSPRHSSVSPSMPPSGRHWTCLATSPRRTR